MSRKKYPLEALRELRQKERDEQALRLGEQARQSARAESILRATERARQTEEQRKTTTLAAERSLLEQGELTAADLTAADRYRHASEGRSDALRARESRALDELRDAVQKESTARGELARKESEAKLMDRHRKDWQDAAARAGERAEEEAILDQWTLKRHGRNRV